MHADTAENWLVATQKRIEAAKHTEEECARTSEVECRTLMRTAYQHAVGGINGRSAVWSIERNENL